MTDTTIRTFGSDDQFFSITDPKGRITHANEVFVRLSTYPEAELVGSPHNIIRHDEMPGGAFQHVWDELHAGRTVSAYVRNLAKDGATYDVFATITPVSTGYLSVRLRPERTELQQLVYSVYAAAVDLESEARAAGDSRHEAALKGAAYLAEQLATLGFTSFTAFSEHLLTQELVAHLAVTPPIPVDESATGPLAVLQSTVREIEADSAATLADLERFGAIAAELSAQSGDGDVAVERLHRLRDALARGTEMTLAEFGPVVAVPEGAEAEPGAEAQPHAFLMSVRDAVESRLEQVDLSAPADDIEAVLDADYSGLATLSATARRAEQVSIGLDTGRLRVQLARIRSALADLTAE